jgi:hypothetical protein
MQISISNNRDNRSKIEDSQSLPPLEPALKPLCKDYNALNCCIQRAKLQPDETRCTHRHEINATNAEFMRRYAAYARASPEAARSVKILNAFETTPTTPKSAEHGRSPAPGKLTSQPGRRQLRSPQEQLSLRTFISGNPGPTDRERQGFLLRIMQYQNKSLHSATKSSAVPYFRCSYRGCGKVYMIKSDNANDFALSSNCLRCFMHPWRRYRRTHRRRLHLKDRAVVGP